MLERLKSLLLLSLVVSSIYLTSQHWITGVAPISTVGTGPDQSEPQPLDVLLPWFLYIHNPSGETELFGPGQVGFEESWQLFRQLTGGFHLVNTRPATAAEWSDMVASGGLEFRLAGRVQLRMWLEALRIQPAQLSTEHYFNHVLLSPESPHIFFRDSHTGAYLLWENIIAENPLAEFLARSEGWPGQLMRRLEPPYTDAAAEWVYVPANPGVWYELYVRNERSVMQSIVNSFFSDLSLVRRVGERDGRTIFTDGRRSVHMDSVGGFEYVEPAQFRPLHEIHGRASLLLSQGLSFVARHGGWTAERRLSRMEVFADAPVPFAEFEFITFFPIPGAESDIGPSIIPLISWRREVGLRVTERNVAAYERFVYLPLRLDYFRSFRVISAERALDVLSEQGLMESEITAMYLAYYQREITTEELLFPVWVIDQGGKARHLVNAFTADLIRRP